MDDTEAMKYFEYRFRETTYEEQCQFISDLGALNKPDENPLKELLDFDDLLRLMGSLRGCSSRTGKHGERQLDVDDVDETDSEDDKMDVDEHGEDMKNLFQSGHSSSLSLKTLSSRGTMARTIYAGKIDGQDKQTYEAYFKRKPCATSTSGYRIMWSCDSFGTAFPKHFIISNIINLVVYEPSLVQGWAEYLNEGKDKWKRGLVDVGKRARQKYLCKVWGERFGNDEDEVEGAKEPAKSLIVKLKFNGQKHKRNETSEDSSIEKQDSPSVKKQALSSDISSAQPPPPRRFVKRSKRPLVRRVPVN